MDESSTDAAGPLAGLVVIDAATMVMVPAAAVVLADFGATVIKVEPPAGDLNRYGHRIPGMPTHDIEYCYYQDNRNKRSLALDLKSAAGLDILRQLVRRADVFLTNTRQRSLERLGIDYPSLRALNVRLIYAHGTGYGDHGAEANKPGFDAVCYWSRSALEATMFPLEGWLGSLPYGSGDHPSGMSLLAAVMMALYRRERTGEGCRVSTSLLANGAWSNAIMLQARLVDARFHPRRPRDNPLNFASVYYLAGDRRVFKFTIIRHDEGWPKLCRVVGREDLIADSRFATIEARSQVTGELVSIFDLEFEKHPIEYWRERFAACDVPFSSLATYDEVVADPQMAANDIFLEIEDPDVGPVRSVDNPLRLDGVARPRPRAAPRLGAHSREVLGELGLAADHIERLIAEGVVGVPT